MSNRYWVHCLDVAGRPSCVACTPKLEIGEDGYPVNTVEIQIQKVAPASGPVPTNKFQCATCGQAFPPTLSDDLGDLLTVGPGRTMRVPDDAGFSVRTNLDIN